MGQLNIKNTDNPDSPQIGFSAIGFSTQSKPYVIDSAGVKVFLLLENVETGITSNILANKGVGSLADRPTLFELDDIYVTIDTFEIYKAVGIDAWSSIPLALGQFVTFEKYLYQFNGDFLQLLTPPSGVIAATVGDNTINFPNLATLNYEIMLNAFDASGMTVFPIRISKSESEYTVNVDVDCQIIFNIILE